VSPTNPIIKAFVPWRAGTRVPVPR
jgi:hypothetical protein